MAKERSFDKFLSNYLTYIKVANVTFNFDVIFCKHLLTEIPARLLPFSNVFRTVSGS